MATITKYHQGGYNAAAPQKNRSELYDGVTGQYTAWDTNGVQTTQRVLTASEAAALAAQDSSGSADANKTTIQTDLRDALANLRAYRDVASPTNAQTIAAVKLLCRVAIALIRRELNELDGTS